MAAWCQVSVRDCAPFDAPARFGRRLRELDPGHTPRGGSQDSARSSECGRRPGTETRIIRNLVSKQELSLCQDGSPTTVVSAGPPWRRPLTGVTSSFQASSQEAAPRRRPLHVRYRGETHAFPDPRGGRVMPRTSLQASSLGPLRFLCAHQLPSHRIKRPGAQRAELGSFGGGRSGGP